MKNRQIFSVLLILLSFVAIQTKCHAKQSVLLFPDQSSCVSGDTIWFDLSIQQTEQSVQNKIVHVVLAGADQMIDYSTIQCKNDWGFGYIKVPDSLSTGIYRLYAYSLHQLGNPSDTIAERSLIVYNRFDNHPSSILLPDFDGKPKIKTRPNSLSLSLPKEHFGSREDVDMTLQIPEDLVGQLKAIIVNVQHRDPLTDFIPASSLFQPTHNTTEHVPDKLPPGILISGHVMNEGGTGPVQKALVFLTIKNAVPHFDYCITDSTGQFRFYLKNAKGLAHLILQVVANDETNCKIYLDNSHLLHRINQTKSPFVLKPDNRVFVRKVVDAARIQRIFNTINLAPNDTFSIEKNYHASFYGQSSKTVYPGLFFHLPDFTEISRELLPGVYYRFRNGHYTLSMENRGLGFEFDTEPLMLIDGVPVFDPEELLAFNSKNIQRIELVFEQRFFGDLKFNGVLAIYTNDTQADDAISNPNMLRKAYKCIQIPIEKEPCVRPDKNTPDLRKVLFNQRYFQADKPLKMQFSTSDMKGDAIIEVIGVGLDNRIFYHTKKITIE